MMLVITTRLSWRNQLFLISTRLPLRSAIVSKPTLIILMNFGELKWGSKNVDRLDNNIAMIVVFL